MPFLSFLTWDPKVRAQTHWLFELGLYRYNLGHNVLRLFVVLPYFFTPQEKQIVIISNKHGIYELLH